MKAAIYFVLFWGITLFSLSAKAQKKVAFVVGNNEYPRSPLTNCERDADSMTNLLGKELGFAVYSFKNLTMQRMVDELDHFKDVAADAEVVLVYFSGHGLQHRGQVYFVPTDGRIMTEDQIDMGCYNLQRILNYYGERMEKGKGANILITDACRNSPFGRKDAPSPTPDLSGFSVQYGTLLACGTHSGYFASDNDSGYNGLFTQSLIKYMRLPINIYKVFEETTAEVVKKSNRGQQPEWISKMKGASEFYFLEPKVIGTNIPLPTQPTQPLPKPLPNTDDIMQKISVHVSVDLADKKGETHFAYRYYLTGDPSMLNKIKEVRYRRLHETFDWSDKDFQRSTTLNNGFSFVGYQWGCIKSVSVHFVTVDGQISRAAVKDIIYDNIPCPIK